MRFQSPCPLTLLRTSAFVALLTVVSGVAVADTIYLKNGRTIHTASAKQVGEKIEFEQFGQTVSIPVSVVLRIERDQRGEEPASPTVLPPETAGKPPEAESTDKAGEEELPPEADPAYWSDRVTSISREKAEIKETIVALRREELAFLFNGNMSTAEVRGKIEAAQARDEELDQELIDLRREARRLGVPPGWLRVKPGATGS